MACTIDFRRLDEGLGGPNNKRKRPSSSPSPMDVDSTTPSSKRAAFPSLSDPDKPASLPAFSLGKPTYDGVIAGKVSGRKWKAPRQQRASAAFVLRNAAAKSWEERAKDRQIKKAFRERKEELKEEIRKNKAEKRERRAEAEKRKAENVLRSGTKLQKITNPKTLQKIAKSKKKYLLKNVPDEIFNKKRTTNLPKKTYPNKLHWRGDRDVHRRDAGSQRRGYGRGLRDCGREGAESGAADLEQQARTPGAPNRTKDFDLSRPRA